MRIEDRRTTTDWKFDFTSLPRWENHNSVHYAYDEFFEIPQTDTLCCIYSIAEVRMMSYQGFLAILQNKENPKVVLNVTEDMNFCDNFSVSNDGNLIFLQPSLYNDKTKQVKHPILILDIESKKFAYVETNQWSSEYKVVEVEEKVFKVEPDPVQAKRDERLQTLGEMIIKVDELKWYPWSKLNQLSKMIYKKPIWKWFNQYFIPRIFSQFIDISFTSDKI